METKEIFPTQVVCFQSLRRIQKINITNSTTQGQPNARKLISSPRIPKRYKITTFTIFLVDGADLRSRAAATPHFSLDQTTTQTCLMAFRDEELLSALLDNLSPAKKARSLPEDKEEQPYKTVGELTSFLCADTSCRGPLLKRSKKRQLPASIRSSSLGVHSENAPTRLTGWVEA